QAPKTQAAWDTGSSRRTATRPPSPVCAAIPAAARRTRSDSSANVTDRSGVTSAARPGSDLAERCTVNCGARSSGTWAWRAVISGQEPDRHVDVVHPPLPGRHLLLRRPPLLQLAQPGGVGQLAGQDLLVPGQR